MLVAYARRRFHIAENIHSLQAFEQMLWIIIVHCLQICKALLNDLILNNIYFVQIQ